MAWNVLGKILIRVEILKEFQHRLRNREPADAWQDFVEITNEIVQILMKKNTSKGHEFTLAELIIVIEELRKEKLLDMMDSKLNCY